MRSVLCVALFALVGCNPGSWFDRPDPTVEKALGALDASTQDADADLKSARRDLEELLRFRCEEGDGDIDKVNSLREGSVDLGLVVFRLNELLGRRFGEEDLDAGEAANANGPARFKDFECARKLLEKIVSDPKASKALVLRSLYLMGNFAFLNKKYQEAIDQYDRVLLLKAAPDTALADSGIPATEDDIARAASWNRAIALKRIDDSKDAGQDTPADSQDSAQDSEPDSANDAADSGQDASDASNDAAQDGSGDSSGDSGNPQRDSGGGDGASQDSASPQGDGGSQGDAAPPPPVDPRELNRFDKKMPFDPDQKSQMHPHHVPKKLDK